MQRKTILVSPTRNSWAHIAKSLSARYPNGLRNVRIIVSTVEHAALMRAALLALPTGALRASGVSTMSAWIGEQLPDSTIGTAVSENRRMLDLYAELRNQEWLKKLFSARTNSDMFPLAETLLSLCNELTEAMLPVIASGSQDAETRWKAALEQLPANVRDVLSDESQLVWAIWQSQLDTKDAHAIRFAQMSRIAAASNLDLVWIGSASPSPIEHAFLDMYATRNAVTQVSIGWSADAVEPLYSATWPELIEDPVSEPVGEIVSPKHLSIIRAKSLEDEAQQGAQTIVNWIAEGKTSLAIIAQDRIVARRIRALLERAQIFVADETGWKLSTTPAASSVMALLDVSIAITKSRALLDLLKSSFIFTEMQDKSTHVLAVESVIRQGNIKGGWGSINKALEQLQVGHSLVHTVEECTAELSGHKSMNGWIVATKRSMESMGISQALKADPAGEQILALFDQLEEIFGPGAEHYSLKEWKKFIALQMEAASYIAPGTDMRVVMLPLNGARMRYFDGVLMAGSDANHLPSQIGETMFFANAVRRELGLATREVLQRQQMRDFTEVLQSGSEVVLSYQAHQNGEIVAVSPWIERLQLTLACAKLEPIEERRVQLGTVRLTKVDSSAPAPRAAVLSPTMLSPSGYNSMMSCPYQYFATRMLGLQSISDLSDQAEKRSYGNWLHEILNSFHTFVREGNVVDREALLNELSNQVFGRELAKNPAALGYFSRWKKVIPVYLKWTSEREAAGWKFKVGEQKLQKQIEFEGGSIMLEGRVDRIDENDAHQEAILDNKSSSFARLMEKVRDAEDHQLPFYGILSDGDTQEAGYVSLEMDDPRKAMAEAPNYPRWKIALQDRIVENVISIRNNDPLPANGVEVACQYCEVKGICRKNAWHNQVKAA